MIPGVLYQARAPIWGPTAGNSPFDSAIELASAEGLFGEEPFSVSALKASEWHL